MTTYHTLNEKELIPLPHQLGIGIFFLLSVFWESYHILFPGISFVFVYGFSLFAYAYLPLWSLLISGLSKDILMDTSFGWYSLLYLGCYLVLYSQNISLKKFKTLGAHTLFFACFYAFCMGIDGRLFMADIAIFHFFITVFLAPILLKAIQFYCKDNRPSFDS